MKTASRTTSVLIVIMIAMLVLLAIYAYFFFDMRRRNQEVAIVYDNIELSETRGARLVSIKNLIEDLKEENTKLHGYIIATQGEADFMSFIDTELEQASGVRATIDTVSIENSNDAAGTEYLRLRVSFGGSWGSVVRYLRMLENMPYKTVIHRVGFSTDVAGPASEEGAAGASTRWAGFIEFSTLKRK